MKTLKDLVLLQKFKYNDEVDKLSDNFVNNNLVSNLHYSGEDSVEAVVNDKLKRNVSFYVLRDFIVTSCSCSSSQPCEHAIAVIKYFKKHLDEEITCYIPDVKDLFFYLNDGYDSKKFYLDNNTKSSFLRTCSYVNNLLNELWNKKFYNYYIKLFYNYFVVFIKINNLKSEMNEYNKQFDYYIKSNLLRISHCYDEFFSYYKDCVKKNLYLFSVVNVKILNELLNSEYLVNLNSNNILGYISYINKNLLAESANSFHYSGYNLVKESLDSLNYYYNKKMIELNNVDVLEKIKSNLDDILNRQVYLEYLLDKSNFETINEVYNKYNLKYNTLLSEYCYLKCLEHYKKYNDLLIRIIKVLKFGRLNVSDVELIINSFKTYFSQDYWLDIGGAIFGNMNFEGIITNLCTKYPLFNFYNDAYLNSKEINDNFMIYKDIHNKELCYIYHSKIINLIPFESNYIDHYNASKIKEFVDKLLLLNYGYFYALDAIESAMDVCYSYALNDIKRYLDYRREK